MPIRPGIMFVVLLLTAGITLLFIHSPNSTHFERLWSDLHADRKASLNAEHKNLVQLYYNDLSKVLELVSEHHYLHPKYERLIEKVYLPAIIPDLPEDLHNQEIVSELLKRHANEILISLDPYTKFQTSNDKNYFASSKKGTYGIIVNRDTALIKINAITPNTPAEIEAFYNKSVVEFGSALTHIVLDLRGNTGGNLEAAYTIVDKFSDSLTLGIFERRKSASSGYNRRTIESFHLPISNLPLSILVDSKTASSAELIAGALQQLEGALVIGETTNGKASGQIQKHVENTILADDTLFITVGKIYLPNGQSYDKKGISPDILALAGFSAAEEAYVDGANSHNIDTLDTLNALNTFNALNNETNINANVAEPCASKKDKDYQVEIFDPWRRRSVHASVVAIGGYDLLCALQAKVN